LEKIKRRPAGSIANGLQSDLAFDYFVICLVDDTHPTLAENLLDFVPTFNFIWNSHS